MIAAGTVIVIVVGVWLGGIFAFVGLIPLAQPIIDTKTDAIVVLTGGSGNISSLLSSAAGNLDLDGDIGSLAQNLPSLAGLGIQIGRASGRERVEISVVDV